MITLYIKSEQYGSRKRWMAVDQDGNFWADSFVKKRLMDWIDYNVGFGRCRFGGER